MDDSVSLWLDGDDGDDDEVSELDRKDETDLQADPSDRRRRSCPSGYRYTRRCPWKYIKKGCRGRCVKTSTTSKSTSGYLVLGGTTYSVTPRMDNDVEMRLSDDVLDEEDFDDDEAANELDRAIQTELQADPSDDRSSWPWSKKTKCPSGLTSRTFCSKGRGRRCSKVKMCVPKGKKTGTLKLGGVNYMVVG